MLSFKAPCYSLFAMENNYSMFGIDQEIFAVTCEL